MIHSIEYDHPCTVHVTLYANVEEDTEDIAEFSLELVSPVEYLFRKFSANEFGKPHYCKLAFMLEVMYQDYIVYLIHFVVL